MTDPNRQPAGIPTGGQFVTTPHSDAVPALTPAAPEFSFDTPEDAERFNAAARFMAEAGIEGKVSPLFTQYRPHDGLDAVVLEIDGRNLTVWHTGTVHPEVEYGDDEDAAWTFRSEPGETTNKNEHEILADLIAGARHDAACQEAWRRDPWGERYHRGEDANINDFGVRFAEDGTRIITVDIDNDGRHCELVQRGDQDVAVFVSGEPAVVVQDELDALAAAFDDFHVEGNGPASWKAMMMAAADKAAQDPGWNPRGVNRP